MQKLVSRAVRLFRRYASYGISIPVALGLILVFPMIQVRILYLFSDRIGHYAMNTERILYELSQRPKSACEFFLFYTSEAPICNQQLHRMWQRIIRIVSYPILMGQIDSLLCKVLGQKYKTEQMKNWSSGPGAQDTICSLEKEKPFLAFTDQELQEGEALLRQLGIPQGEPYVCLLVRDPAYLEKQFPNGRWGYQGFRDAEIETYAQAALYLAERGYYVVRMGSCVKKSFTLGQANVIDYANHPLRSDFLDIYLSAHCCFFISTSSGLDSVAQIFRRPVMFTNLAPFRKQLQYWYPCELFIPKRLKHLKTQEWVSLSRINQIFQRAGDVNTLLQENNLELINNSNEEIREAVAEMESRLAGRWVETKAAQQRQASFKALVPLAMVADNDIIMAHPERFRIKIGARFLQENDEWVQ